LRDDERWDEGGEKLDAVGNKPVNGKYLISLQYSMRKEEFSLIDPEMASDN